MYSKHSQIEKPKVVRSRFYLGLSYLIYYHPKFKYFGYHQNVGLALAFAFVLNSKLLEIIFNWFVVCACTTNFFGKGQATSVV